MEGMFTETRPWGEFRQFTTGQAVTVKILTIRAGQRLSLQTHQKRSEFWRVLSGAPLITIGTDTTAAAPGDEFDIGVGVVHRIEATDEDARLLEIATGEFDENDITRIEDSYGRA
jgi:mannose-6-phosphate isomerase-like protein (cupin superfamily)